MSLKESSKSIPRSVIRVPLTNYTHFNYCDVNPTLSHEAHTPSL